MLHFSAIDQVLVSSGQAEVLVVFFCDHLMPFVVLVQVRLIDSEYRALNLKTMQNSFALTQLSEALLDAVKT